MDNNEIPLMIAKMMWPEIDTSTVEIVMLPEGYRAYAAPDPTSKKPYGTETIEIKQYAIVAHMGYSPKSNILVIKKIALHEADIG